MDSERYYNRKLEILTLEEERKTLRIEVSKKRVSPGAYQEFMRDNKDPLSLVPKVKAHEKHIKKLRKQRKVVRQSSDDDKQRRITAIEARILKQQQLFNKQYNDLMLEPGIFREWTGVK